MLSHPPDVEHTVRVRLRSLRTAQGLSLEDVAALTHLSTSTISRIETGKRSIGLDVLPPLARALQVDLETLLDTSIDESVVIRPTSHTEPGQTTWMLSRATSPITAMKMRLEPTAADADIEQRIHPGRDWLFVLHGRVKLRLGDRTIAVRAGEAAEFNTLTPHAVSAVDHPAELIMIFDRDGMHAHARPGESDGGGSAPATRSAPAQ